jgi:hypothetical protein
MDPITKNDLDDALRGFATKADLKQAVGDLRIEWRTEIIAQTRWLATLAIAQFFGTMAAVWFMLSRLHS